VTAEILDLAGCVRFTVLMYWKSTCVVCPVIGSTDAEEYTKQMVRQRHAGETGGETG